MSARRNQRDAILAVLVAARGGEVSSYELAQISLQYCARVSELRKLGWVITNRVEHVDGQTRGYFKLDLKASKSSASVTAAPKPQQQQQTTAESSLFGDLTPLKYPD